MLTVVKNQLKVMFLSIKYNIIRQMVNKKSFLFSVLLMFISNASFLVQWVVILSVTNDVSLSMKQILLVWGFAAVSFGYSQVLFAGSNNIPNYIINGKLDAYLVQPKNALLSVITSNTSASAVGDVLYGYVVTLIAIPSIKTFIFTTIFGLLGAIIYTAFIVILYSLIFFSINFKELSVTLARIPTSFATYPETIFSGAIKVILYTIFPLGFIVYLPIKFMLQNNVLILGIVLLFAIFITLIAFIIFNIGLKRYSSTNLMGARV